MYVSGTISTALPFVYNVLKTTKSCMNNPFCTNLLSMP